MSERPQPRPEHVYAVAVVLAQANGTEWDLMPGDDDVYRRDARAILTSDDPAVHAALLAALTRAGVLSELFGVQNDNGGPVTGPPEYDAAQSLADERNLIALGHALDDRWSVVRYYSTAWQPLASPTRAQDGPQEPADAPEAPVEPHDATGGR